MADGDAAVHHRINELIEQEHRLRTNEAGLDDADRQKELAELETQLDQAWDLLRQRQARREFDQDPEGPPSARSAWWRTTWSKLRRPRSPAAPNPNQRVRVQGCGSRPCSGKTATRVAMIARSTASAGS
jgi:hypothetical protein